MIKTYWKRENGILKYEITVPANAEAILEIPDAEAGAMEGMSVGLKEIAHITGFKRYQLSSGNYKLQFKKR